MLFELDYQGWYCLSFSPEVFILFWREGATAPAGSSCVGVLEHESISHNIFYPGDFCAEDVE